MKDLSEYSIMRKSAWAGLLLVIVAAITLEATSLIQYYFSQRGIRQEATQKAESQLETTKLRVLSIVDQAESAVRNNLWIAQWALTQPDSLGAVSRLVVENNPVIVGSTVALVPGYNPDHPLLAPYCHKSGADGMVEMKTLATPEYDYPHQEWFTKPIELGSGYWSEPYVDEGGGEILMTTYSVPVYDSNGRTAAVLTADVSLDWLAGLVGNVKLYPNSYSLMISRAGKIMVSPDESLVMKKTVQEVSAGLEDSASFAGLNRSMLSGESGSAKVRIQRRAAHAFYAPIEKTGWSMLFMIPDAEIFGDVRRIGMIVKILQLLGLVMLVLIMRSVARNQLKFKELNERKDRMESELRIARGIQMSMIPKIFPPFPERKDLDMYARLVPAKEVGGDLYDFYIRDEKLFFCIGDVSGKGVPASLVMAVTRSLFRTVSGHENSPQRIVTTMNESMAEVNENNMFVTFFCGILDLQTGHMRYCNAGHNAPVLLSETKQMLPVEPNVPLGIVPGMVFREQETDMRNDDAIFLYTDGLTEAENIHHELFSEERMLEALSGRKSAKGYMEHVQDVVGDFVGTASQSDDLTMLFIHYLDEKNPGIPEYHLVIQNDIQQIPQLTEFVENIARERSLDHGLTLSLNLALEEVVTNVILYAYPEGTSGQVDIEAIIHEHSLSFIVSDSGSPFDPTERPEVDVAQRLEDRPIGGLGIHLVRSIMDEVSYARKEDRNILTMNKNI